MNHLLEQLCPCGSSKPLKTCCMRYIQGDESAPSAELLMRSRYTAYVLKRADYLWQTWSEASRQHLTISEIEQSFVNTEWLSLKIVETSDNIVEFIATYRDTATAILYKMHERSRFCVSDQRWFYIDGIKPEIKRNDPCPCHSGKKYKKCCGK